MFKSIGLASNSSHPVAMACSRSLSSACGHADYRDVAGSRIVLEVSYGFPVVNAWHFKIHQNYVGRSVTANLQPFSLSSQQGPRNRQAAQAES
jgi:hypothetical protein